MHEWVVEERETLRRPTLWKCRLCGSSYNSFTKPPSGRQMGVELPGASKYYWMAQECETIQIDVVLNE